MKNTKISSTVYYICLIITSISIVLPFLWILSTSFDQFDSYGLPFPPRLFPENPSLFNYKMALMNMPIIKYLGNTVIVAILSLVLNIFIATFSGFCLSKGIFPGKKMILLLIMSSMMVPFEIKLIPMYRIIQFLGLSNTYLGVVLPGVMTNAMYIFFIKKFCDNLPTNLYEAGVIDGASKFTIYFKIFLPLMGPVVATLAILDVMNVWNDLLWPMVILTNTEMSTVQVALARFTTNSSMQSHAGIATALSMMSIIPLMMIFIFLQKYIVQSVASTGIKQ